MNERIRELIKQATHVEEPDGLFLREVFDKEKFAELIVRECIEIAREEEGHSPFEGPVETKIKLYFGVEE